MLIRIFEMPQQWRDKTVREWIKRDVAALTNSDQTTIRISFSSVRTDAHPKLRIVIGGLSGIDQRNYRVIVLATGVACCTYLAQRDYPHVGYENPPIAMCTSALPPP